jgi:hypothetical protein
LGTKTAFAPSHHIYEKLDGPTMNEFKIEVPSGASGVSDLRRVPLAELSADLDVNAVLTRVLPEASKTPGFTVGAFNSYI